MSPSDNTDTTQRPPGKVTQHWLGVALERVCAGEPELAVLADYGYVPQPDSQSAHTIFMLVARIREALGDNGERMQHELIEYARHLKAQAGSAAELRESVRACRDGIEALQGHISWSSDPQGKHRALAHDLLRDCAIALGEAEKYTADLPGFTRETARTIQRGHSYRIRERKWNQQSNDRFRNGVATVLDVCASITAEAGLEVKVTPIGSSTPIWIDAAWLSPPSAAFSRPAADEA